MIGLLTTDVQLERKDKVVAVTDLPGVPEGTAGIVLLVDGFRWIRYRVLFDNGVDLGTLDRKYVGSKDEYADLLRRRDAGEFDVVEGAAAVDGAAAEDDGAAAGGAADPVINGVPVPIHLIERSKNRRALLAG